MDLSVVVPAYREGPRIYDNLRWLLSELDKLDIEYEVLVVSDGNTDATVPEAERVGSQRIRVLAYPVNRGKGYAISYGVAHARGPLVTFIDADMELHPGGIKNFLDLMRDGDFDIVTGSKRHRRSHVSYPWFRRLQSLIYQLIIRILFDLRVRDTQTGLKLFRREVLRDVVPLLAVKRFAFDLELLVVAHHLGYRKIVEAPIDLRYQFASTISPGVVFHILWDTAAILYRLRIMKYYDHRRLELLRTAEVAPGVGSQQDAVRRR